ncbi:hypothetical protein U1Q18_022484 [Sarracenia purpurea var. burkii]
MGISESHLYVRITITTVNNNAKASMQIKKLCAYKNGKWRTLLVRSRTSVLALDRQERDQRTNFSQASRTTFRRSLVVRSGALSETRIESWEKLTGGGSGGDGWGLGSTFSAEQEQVVVVLVLEVRLWLGVGERMGRELDF